MGRTGSTQAQAVALGFDGSLVWRRVEPPQNSQSSYMGSGGLVVGGWDGPFGSGNLLYAKYSAQGSLIRSDTFDLDPQTDDYLMELELGGAAYGVGAQYDMGAGEVDAVIEARDTADFSLLWRRVINRTSGDVATDASAAGKWLWVSGYENREPSLTRRGVVHLLDTSGNLCWSREVDLLSPEFTRLYAIWGDEAGCWAAGYSGTNSLDVGLLVRMDTLGQITLWDTLSSDTAHIKLLGVAAGSDGSVFVAGELWGSERHAYAARLSAGGSLLWEAVYPEPSSADGLALAPGDTLYLFGQLNNYPAVFKLSPEGDFMLTEEAENDSPLKIRAGRGWLEAWAPGRAELVLYDVLGRPVAKGAGTLRAWGLKPGVYILRVGREARKITVR